MNLRAAAVTTSKFVNGLALFVMLIHHVGGHGRLMEPPARNAMWRFGYPNPVNYNDNGKLFPSIILMLLFAAGSSSSTEFSMSTFNLKKLSPSSSVPVPELFCGGWAVQWEQNSGKCGVCGDAAHLNQPRPHEAGGEYGKGIISRRYVSGQVRNLHNAAS